ncbi:MAG: CSLREA domain-containing protein [Chloroflexaceae bacterium]|nr:CSLREA domain-containing protein [Chloroflexaceae bacterium]
MSSLVRAARWLLAGSRAWVGLAVVGGVIAVALLLSVGPVQAADILVTTAVDTNDGTCDSHCSLREAIAAASAGDTIRFADSYTITLTSTLTLNKNLVIAGGEHAIVISGNNAVRVFTIASGVVVTLDTLTIQDGKTVFVWGDSTSENGGGIFVGSSAVLTLTNSRVLSNTAHWYNGGGISNEGTLTIIDSTISGNTADDFGGGIYSRGRMILTDSTVSDNTAADAGGIYVASRPVIIRGSTIAANSAVSDSSYGGGGIFANSATLTIEESLIIDNRAGIYGGGGGIYNGGGIYATGGTLDIQDTTFDGNAAVGFGGALSSGTVQTTIRDSSFINNQVEGWGGAIEGSSLEIINTTFSGNRVTDDMGQGGALSIDADNYDTRIVASTFIQNEAPKGGAIALWAAGSDHFQVIDSTFIENTAVDGGGIYFDTLIDDSFVVGSRFLSNHATNRGGGLFNDGDVYVSNTVFSGNQANEGGGIYNAEIGFLFIFNTTLVGNSATMGGGIYNGIILWLYNSIIAENTSGGDCINNSRFIINDNINTLIGDGSCNEGQLLQGFLSGDPGFVDANGADDIFGTLDDDVRLHADSPAVDSGDSSALPADTTDLDGDGDTTELLPLDLFGNPRIVNTTVDRGCMNGQTPTPPPRRPAHHQPIIRPAHHQPSRRPAL